jgi:hypothetical protein
VEPRRFEPASEHDLQRTGECVYCGQFMPWRELRNHLQATHPNVVAARAHWTKDSNRVWVRVALPTFLLWFAALVVALAVGAPATVGAIILIAGFVALLGPFVYARWATRTDIEAVREMPHFCQVCGEPIPGLDLKSHTRQEHPEMWRLHRWTEMYFLVAAAIVCVPLGYAAVLLLPHVSSPSGGFGRGIAGIGMLAWMGLAMAWMRLVYIPRLVRSRERWSATHFESPR